MRKNLSIAGKDAFTRTLVCRHPAAKIKANHSENSMTTTAAAAVENSRRSALTNACVVH